IAFSIVLATLAGCKKPSDADDDLSGRTFGEKSTESITFPELGPSKVIRPGIVCQESTINRAAGPMRVWYYKPAKSTGKLPLVLVPPAGSTLAAGMALMDDDRNEHFPYVQEGFAVASFDIDGNVSDKASEATMIEGARKFRQADAGLSNARTAIDFIL